MNVHMSKNKYVLPKEPGVYACVHIPSGAKYIGSAVDSMRSRERGHWSLLKKEEHHSRRWQSLYSSEGLGVFEFFVIEKGLPIDVRELEQEYIKAWVEKAGREMLLNESIYVFGTCEEGTRARMSDAQRRRHAEHPELAIASATRMCLLNEDPAFAAAHVERLRVRNADPVFLSSWTERTHKMHEDPIFAEAHAERMRKRHEDPVFAAGISKRMSQLYEDPTFLAGHLARLQVRNESPDFQANRVEHLLAVMSDPIKMADIVLKRNTTRAKNKDAISASLSASTSAFWADPVKKAEHMAKSAATRAKNKLLRAQAAE
jgi:hypothetical protein